MNFGLVREALQERALLIDRLAPHLVRPVSFLYPLSHPVWERAYVGAGLQLYDRLGGAKVLPGHQHLTRRGALQLAPSAARDALVGAMRYWDAQVDDARHTMELARTAVLYGAAVATSARVTDFLREGERVVGVQVRDLEAGRGHRRAGPPGHQRHRRVDRRHPAAHRARPYPRPRIQGHPPGRAADRIHATRA
jgi:glycerol-3-phosphate dehydrogenase